MAEWVIITAKFSATCYMCGDWIDKGDTAYWKKLIGIKHYPECPTGITEDDSRLIIQESDEDFYLS